MSPCGCLLSCRKWVRKTHFYPICRHLLPFSLRGGGYTQAVHRTLQESWDGSAKSSSEVLSCTPFMLQPKEQRPRNGKRLAQRLTTKPRLSSPPGQMIHSPRLTPEHVLHGPVETGRQTAGLRWTGWKGLRAAPAPLNLQVCTCLSAVLTPRPRDHCSLPSLHYATLFRIGTFPLSFPWSARFP